MLCGLFGFADAFVHAPYFTGTEKISSDFGHYDNLLSKAEDPVSSDFENRSEDMLLPPQYNLAALACKEVQHVFWRIRWEKKQLCKLVKSDNSRFSFNHKCHEINQFIGEVNHLLQVSSRRYSPNFLLKAHCVFLI